MVVGTPVRTPVTGPLQVVNGEWWEREESGIYVFALFGNCGALEAEGRHIESAGGRQPPHMKGRQGQKTYHDYCHSYNTIGPVSTLTGIETDELIHWLVGWLHTYSLIGWLIH